MATTKSGKRVKRKARETTIHQLKPLHPEKADVLLAEQETAVRGLLKSKAVCRLDVEGASLLLERGPTPFWFIVLGQYGVGEGDAVDVLLLRG